METKTIVIIVVVVIVLFLAYWYLSSYYSKQTEQMTATSDSAEYMIRFVSNWGTNAQEINYPQNPHTGNMFLITNNDQFSLFLTGTLATKAISNTSMFGTIDDLSDLVANNPNIGMVVTAPVLPTPGEYTLKITADKDHHYISFVTMVAPSPDWFTGVSNLDLMKDGQWLKQTMVPMFVFDAGTDEGTAFNTEHYPKTPADVVTLKNDTFLYPDSKLKPIAFLLIQKIK